MSSRPYSTRRALLKPDLNDPELYGAWGMTPERGLLLDRTLRGNDGVPGASSGVEQTILGPMRRYNPNSGAAASTIGAANAFQFGDLAVSFWVRKDFGTAGTDVLVNYRLDGTDQWDIRYAAAGISIVDDIDNAGAVLYTTPVTVGRLVHVVGVMNALENLLYIDRVLVGSGTNSSDNWASFVGQLYHGSQVALSAVTDGIISPLFLYNAFKDQDWVMQDYLKGAKACQFKTDWGVKQSIGNEVANARVGMNSSPYEIINGTWQMTMDTIEDTPDVKVMENIVAGVCAVPTSLFDATPTEAAFGTQHWWIYKGGAGTAPVYMPIASQNTAWNVAGQNGYRIVITGAEALALFRVANGIDTLTLINAGAGYVAIDIWYELVLTRRYDGVFVLYIRGGAYADWTTVGTSAADLTYTTSNYNVLDLDAGDRFAYSDRKGDHAFVKMLGVVPPG